ncbi:YopX family protein [Listeria seeligeri]|uniref:YopX family protein n=1 Tax=Listeria seeligeri TaxID=1640 RepID=UPI0022EAB8AA|nr:YopX family protein [Listeria seeligeri]
MRPIEFKAQNVNGVWVCGNFSILKKKIGNVDAGSYISNSAGEPFAYKVRPETVSQFTGLKDKSGKKIFEGDIVKVTGDEDCEFTSIVEYFGEGDYPAFDMTAPEDYYFESNKFSEILMSISYELEVIGNIHENPELLEVATC